MVEFDTSFTNFTFDNSIYSQYGLDDPDVQNEAAIFVQDKEPVTSPFTLDALESYDENTTSTGPPSTENPVIDGNNTDTSTVPPRIDLSTPQGYFATHLQDAINQLPDSTLAPFTQEGLLTTDDARSLLSFAWNHPDASVDPAVRELVDQLAGQAAVETKAQFQLPADWQTPSPDTAASNQDINAGYDRNFERVASSLASSPGDANAIIFAHYHPEYQNSLSSEQQALLSAATTTAEEETNLQKGTPDNWNFTPGSKDFDTKLSLIYDHAFNKALANLPNLSAKDKAELQYLHYNPSAQVPDRARLLGEVNTLNSEARSAVASAFAVPSDFPVQPFSQVHNTMIQREFSIAFANQVNSFFPPLSDSVKNALLATKGIDGSALSADNQVLFNQIQGQAKTAIINTYGIPLTWEPSAANISLDKASNLSSLDWTVTRNAINHYEEAQNHVNQWAKDYLTEGEYTLNQNIIGGVSAALSHLREMLYATEGAQVEAQNKNAIAQQEGAKSQNIISDEKRAKAKEDQDKEWAFYKFLEAVLPGFLAKLVEDAVKFVFWVLDTITGGAITMICEACHCKPIAVNPLETMGIVNHETAKTLDLVAQIIVIIAEMVASTIIAQPELVAAEVAEMTADITATVGEKVAEEAVKLAMEEAAKVAAKQGIKDVVDATGKDITKEVTKQAIQKLSKSEVKAIEKALKETLKEAVQESLEGTTKEAVKEGVEKSSKEFVKKVVQRALKEEGFEVGKTGAQAAMERVSNFVESVLDKMRNLLKMSKDSEIEDELIRSFTKNAKKLAAKNATGNIAGKFGAVQLVKDIVGGSIQAIGNGIEAGMKFQQAQLHLELAQLDAQLAELTTDLQVLKKGLQQLLETTKSTTEWIGRINKEQAQTWKTLSIHFVA